MTLETVLIYAVVAIAVSALVVTVCQIIDDWIHWS